MNALPAKLLRWRDLQREAACVRLAPALATLAQRAADAQQAVAAAAQGCTTLRTGGGVMHPEQRWQALRHLQHLEAQARAVQDTVLAARAGADTAREAVVHAQVRCAQAQAWLRRRARAQAARQAQQHANAADAQAVLAWQSRSGGQP